MNRSVQNLVANSILKEYDTAIVDITPYKSNQKYGGTGLILNRKNSKITVLGTVEQTSARKIKIPFGTIIKSINGKSINNLCLEDVWEVLRGDIGTNVTIMTDKNISYLLTRELPSTPTVSHTIIENNTVIIKILSFDNDAPKNITKILQQLPADMNIILDLRNNGGGLVTSVSGTVSLFVKPHTTLFKQISRDKYWNDDYTTYNKTGYIPKSIVILINQATSAGALLAAKVLQKENAIIVGTSQETISQIKGILPITEVYSLKMPFAKFYFPDGTVASGTTVTSDIPLDTDSLEDETLYEKIATIIKNR
jgi:carboxyl-terminal processing protease